MQNFTPTKNRRGWLLGIMLIGCLLGIGWGWLWQQTRKTAVEIAVVKVRHQQAQGLVTAAMNSQLNAPANPVAPELNLTALTPEQRRRVITLNLFDQFKRKHELSPPAPRKNPPPTGPNGFFFPELTENAEYSRLQLAMIRNNFLWREKKSLQTLGLAPEAVEKALDILAESQMAVIDFNQLNKSEGKPGYSGKTYQSLSALREGFDQELRTLLGNEKFAQYGKSFDDPLSGISSSVFNNLAMRLSYSDSPLTDDRIEQLNALVDAKGKTVKITQQTVQELPNGSVRRISTASFNPYTYIQSDEFLAQAQSVLNPEQIAGLQQLRAERQAGEKRNKLPKSSELPRNATPAPAPKK